ncbi:hypothetical protein L218DRAFT_913700 [Marasmius fiardii PR-910]|nr:hypothetical protein L218DRAFT_913700 [Marasmius fiardii PR-910]
MFSLGISWKAPWVLGQVCQRWRKVVMSTPYLWNVVELRYPGRRDSEGLLNYRCCPSFLGLVQRRLERASEPFRTEFYFQLLPLLTNVRECSLEPISFHEEFPLEASTPVAVTLSKLHRLTLTGPNAEGVDILCGYLELPALKTLRFEDHDLGSIPISCVRHSRKLGELILKGRDVDIEPCELLWGFARPYLRNIRRVEVDFGSGRATNEECSGSSRAVTGASELEKRVFRALRWTKDSTSSCYHPDLSSVVVCGRKWEWRWGEGSTGGVWCAV